MSRNSLVQAQRPGPGTLLPITQQGRAQVAAQVFPDMLPAGCCTERSQTRRGRDEGSQEDTQSGGLRRTESAGRYSLIQTVDPHGSTAGSLLTLQLWADSALSRPVQITDLPPLMSKFSVSREWGWGSSGHLRLRKFSCLPLTHDCAFPVASPPGMEQWVVSSACVVPSSSSHLKNFGFYTERERMMCQ